MFKTVFLFDRRSRLHACPKKFVLNQLSFTRIYFEVTIFFASSFFIHYPFRDFTVDSPSTWRIQSWFTIKFANSLWFTTNSLWFLSIYFQFTTYIANSLLIHYPFRWIPWEFNMFFAYLIRIYYVFRELTLNFNLFREFNSNSLSFSLIHIEFTIFCEFTSNSLSFSRIYFKFLIFFAKKH